MSFSRPLFPTFGSGVEGGTGPTGPQGDAGGNGGTPFYLNHSQASGTPSIPLLSPIQLQANQTILYTTSPSTQQFQTNLTAPYPKIISGGSYNLYLYAYASAGGSFAVSFNLQNSVTSLQIAASGQTIVNTTSTSPAPTILSAVGIPFTLNTSEQILLTITISSISGTAYINYQYLNGQGYSFLQSTFASQGPTGPTGYTGPTGPTGPTGTQTLAQTLVLGNNAGSTGIDMNNNAISNVSTLNTINVGAINGVVGSGGNLVVGRGNLTAGQTGTTSNYIFGSNSLSLATTANNNVVIGSTGLRDTTSGSFNNVIGNLALIKNTTGNSNNAFGYSALNGNTTGNNNVAMGDRALWLLTSGSDNVIIGKDAGTFATGSNNTCLGRSSNASTNLTYATAIGSGAVATTSNTIQLGRTSDNVNCPNTLSVTSNLTVDTNTLFVNASNNRVGIGTSTPAYTLDVIGNIVSSADATINGLTVGRGGGNNSQNTAIGFEALSSINSAGGQNVAIGYQALRNNQNGTSNNIAIGYQALYSNKGIDNFACGYQALYNNTNGLKNTSVGHYSLYNNIHGCKNIALGVNSLYNNNGNNSSEDGWYNTAIGYESGQTNTTGSYNTYIGYQADCATNALSNSTAIGANALITKTNQVVIGSTSGLAGTTSEVLIPYGILTTAEDALINTLTIGLGGGQNQYNTALGHYALLVSDSSSINNTAVGFESLRYNTTGNSNTALGYQSLYFGQTGINNTALGCESLFNNNSNDNTAVGFRSLYSNTDGYNNIAIGTNSLYTNTTGASNIAIGYESLYFNETTSQNAAFGAQSLLNTTGSSNTAYGNFSGTINTTGSYNTYIGYQADADAVAYDNSTAIGAFAKITKSNQVVIGSTSGLAGATIEVYIPYGDLKISEDCFANSYTTTSDYRIKENVETIHNNPNFTIDNLRPVTYTNKISKSQDIGLIAHELQEHYPFLVKGEKDGPENQSINYTGLIPILIKEIKELKERVKTLEKNLAQPFITSL